MENNIEEMITKAQNIQKDSKLQEITNHIKQAIEAIEMQKKSIGNIDTPYRPRKSTFKKLLKTNEEWIHLLRSISPFYRNNAKSNVFHELITQLYNVFDNRQIRRMEVETRLEVIDHRMQALRKTIRENRNSLASLPYMFQDRYEEKRLEYLLNHSKAPILLTEEDYKNLENIIIDVVEQASKSFFNLDEKNNIVRNPYFQKDEFLIKLISKYMKHFDKMHEGMIRIFRDYVLAVLYTIENNEIFQKYKEYKIKPITYRLREIDFNEPLLYNYQLREISIIAKHAENIIKLDDEEELLAICSIIIKTIEGMINQINKGKMSFEKMTYFENDYLDIIESLPVFIAAMKKIKSRS